MKHPIILVTISALLLSAAFIYSCQKEKVNALSQTLTDAPQYERIDRSGTCSTVNVANGVGLIICGTDSGTVSCYTCGENHASEVVATNPDYFGFTGSSVFSLYNPTGQNITAGLFFNCALQAPIWVTIPRGATRSFTVAPNGQGCCEPTPCY